MKNNGQLLEARQNPFVYTFILLSIAVILFLLVLYIILKKFKKTKSYSEWKEKQQKSPTKKSNILTIAMQANLTEAERDLLWTICKIYKLKNIEYLYKDNVQLDTAFKDYYRQLEKASSKDSQDKSNEDEISNLFALRYKLEKLRASKLYITSTKKIKEGSEFYYFAEGNKFVLTLAEKDEFGCWLKCPENLCQAQYKPEALSKINLSFSLKLHVTFGLTVRILRYEKRSDGFEYLFFNHNDHLIPIQRRDAKRIDVNADCYFSAVDVTYEGKEEKALYSRKSTSYKGHMIDLSCSGCKMATSMPIKDGQLIYIEFQQEDKLDLHLFGKIIRTSRSKDNQNYVLHISFFDIEKSVQNKIYAFVYNYL